MRKKHCLLLKFYPSTCCQFERKWRFWTKGAKIWRRRKYFGKWNWDASWNEKSWEDEIQSESEATYVLRNRVLLHFSNEKISVLPSQLSSRGGGGEGTWSWIRRCWPPPLSKKPTKKRAASEAVKFTLDLPRIKALHFFWGLIHFEFRFPGTPRSVQL